MDPALDPLAISASAPFPTIPVAAASPRHRAGGRPRRHAAPFRSEHPAAAASSRRAGSDASLRRPAAHPFAREEVAPSGGSSTSWGASRDASFVFGSGVAGSPETTRRSFSSGSFSAAVGSIALDGSGPGRRSDAGATGGDDPVQVTDSSDRASAVGSDCSLCEGFSPDLLDDQTEQLGEGSGAPFQTVQGESAVARTLASPPCTDETVPTGFSKSGDSFPVGSSVDEGSLVKDGTEVSAHGAAAQQNLFVFGGHAGFREFTANATQTNISKDPKNVFGSSNNDLPQSKPREISEDVGVNTSSVNVPYDIEALASSELAESGKFDEISFTIQDHNVASRNKAGIKGMSTNRRSARPKKLFSVYQVSSSEPISRSDHYSGKLFPDKRLNLKEVSSFALEDSGTNCAQLNSNKSALQTTESSHVGTKVSSVENTEHSGPSDFIFSASTFDQHDKKTSGGICHANSIQSFPTSAIGPARSEISAGQQGMDLAAQCTEDCKTEPSMLTVDRGAERTKTENSAHHDNCETWRLRGNQAYAGGHLNKAEECYTHGIDSFSPNEASRKALMLCYSNRAATRMSLGKMREALSDCREAIGIDPSFLKAQVRAANCLLALGDVEEAQKAFEMCLKSKHQSNLDQKIVEEASDGLHKAQKLSGFILQSKEYLVKKAFDKIPSALQMISDALSISVYSDNLMAMKAQALLLLQRYEEVIQFCEETLHLAERNSVHLCPDEHSEISNLDNNGCSVKLWRYHLIAKSYFFLGKLEEAQQFLKKYETTKVVECRCGKQSEQSILSFSMEISELLRLKAAGNEAFQAGKYSKAVEHYTAALLRNSESLRFLAVCFCNRAAAYQAMGQILDAIADCSLAIALDADYAKAISRRSSLYELIRDYSQAANDLRRLISLLEKQLQENMHMPSEKTEGIRNNLTRANLRFSSLERDSRKGASLNMYLILGIEPSSSTVDIKKAYRKAALRHHPDKAGKFLVRSENISDALWREITNEIRRDADYLFKIIGKAYAMLSDPTMKRE